MKNNKNQRGNHYCINSNNTTIFVGNDNFDQPAHRQMEGTAHYDGRDKFLFAPAESAAGALPRFRGLGLAQQLSDGTFDFIRRPRLRAQSQLIRKLAHGRVSKTKDGAIQLTLKVFEHEGLNIGQTIAQEACIATKAVVEWQLKR